MILKNCRYVILNTEEKFVEENIDIRVVDGKIVEVNRGISAGKDEKIVDCSSFIAVPGIIDPHTHLFTYSLRGYLLNVNWDRFWNEIFKYEIRLDPKTIKSFIIRNGYSLVVTYDPFKPQNYGLKAPFIISGRYVRSEEKKHFNDRFIHVDFLRKLSPEFFAEVVRENREAIVSTHISNTRNYVFLFKKNYGDFPVSYLEKLDGLRENVVLVGLEWISSREIELIKEANAKVIFTPQCSLLYSPGGFPPIKEFIEKNVPIALGSCSLTCSSGFLFDEMKEAIRFIRSSYWDFKTSVRKIFKAVVHGASEILKLKCHKVESGSDACITLFRASSPNYPITSSENVLENIVMFSQPEDVIYLLTPNILT